MSQEPNDRVALITGAGRKRVGNAIAWSLGRAGYRIALHYFRSHDAAKITRSDMRSENIDVEIFQADTANELEVDRMFDLALQRFGRLDALVTCASVWDARPLEETTAADMRRNFDINTLGTFLCARRAGLIMAGQAEGGAIITFGDWAVHRPYANYLAYFTAKGAIPTLTRALAVELAQRNPRIRVNCLHPGPVLFPDDLTASEQQELVESTLVKLANDPESVAHAVRFLIENAFVTGVSIPIDGGRTIYAREK